MPSHAPAVPTRETVAPPAWRLWLAYATVALMPLSLNIGRFVLPTGKRLNLSPLDPLLPVLMLLVAWDLWKDRTRPWGLPLPNLAWAGWALLSLCWGAGLTAGEWGRAAILQTLLIGLCAVWVFRQLAPDAACYRRLALVLGASTGLCLLYALFQYLQPECADAKVSSWFYSRGQLAALIALVVPAAAAFALLDEDPIVRVAAGAVAGLGLCVCLSGGGVLAAGAGILAVAAALWVRSAGAPAEVPLGGMRRAALTVMALVFLAVVVWPRLPRHNEQVLWKSLTGWTEVTPEDGDREEVPTARLRRHQAVWNLLLAHDSWKKGVGAGNFQNQISGYYSGPYGPYPKPSARTDDIPAWDVAADEPDTFGLVETTAVELGVCGVALLLWVFLAWGGAAACAWARTGTEDPARQVLALAVLGAAAGGLVFAFFGSPLVRGAGGPWAFFMGLALFLNASRGPQGIRV